MRSGRDAWKLSRKMSFNQDNREDNREETQGGGGAVKKISHAKTQRRKGAKEDLWHPKAFFLAHLRLCVREPPSGS